ncbi:MAG: DNA primase [Granulosicoccus sp.]|nr:DNA primase [Granulosicoccus sp.]
MAGQIPQHFIDDLLAKVDIVDVIDQRVTLKKSGSNYSACCPFHNEKTPSFTVSQSKQFYHCFGCSANGNAISFLMEYEGMHFVDAIESLADSVGLDVPRDQQAAQQRDDSKPLYALMASIASFYQAELRKSPEAIDYLKARGLSGDTARRFGIGYVPDGWDGLQKQFPGEEAALLKTGMLIKGDAGKRPYQRFRHRIMFPIRDRRGRVIGFGGRVLDQQEPKYLNSPETPLFHKGSELYGLYEARKAAQDATTAIVVEGYMDVVVLAQHGIDNAVATLGTAANQQHSEMLFRTVPNIVFCFDGDRAGRAAAWRALTATLPCLTDGHDAHFLFLPDGEDPDSLVRSRGAAGFRDLMSSRTPIIDYLYEHLASDLDMRGIGGKAMLAEKAKPLLATIPKGVYRQLALRRLEVLIGLPLGSEHAGPSSTTATGAHRILAARDAGLTPMSRAVLLCLQHPAVVRAVPADDYEINPELPGADVLLKLIGFCDSDPGITTARLLERFRDGKQYAYLVKLAGKSYYPDARELDEMTAVNEFVHCIARLRERSRKNLTDKVELSARTGLLGLRRR